MSDTSNALRSRTGVLLRAADVGEGVQFQTLGGLAVAASRMEDGAEAPVVIHLRHDGYGTVDAQVLGLSWNPGDGGAVELRDVWGTRGTGNAFDANVFALACHSEAGCVVLTANSSTDDALRPLLQESGATAPQGLVVWGDSLCVYGAGIHCHDGTRWTRWAADDERLLRDMAFDGLGAVAVGDRGRILVEDGSGFVAATTGATSDLYIAYIHDGRIEAGSEQEIVDRTPSRDWSQCALDIGGLVALAGPIADTAGRLVRRILDGDAGSWTYCAQGELAAEEPLLSSSFAPCGVAENPMLLSASTLWSSTLTSLYCVYVD